MATLTEYFKYAIVSLLFKIKIFIKERCFMNTSEIILQINSQEVKFNLASILGKMCFMPLNGSSKAYHRHPGRDVALSAIKNGTSNATKIKFFCFDSGAGCGFNFSLPDKIYTQKELEERFPEKH